MKKQLLAASAAFALVLAGCGAGTTKEEKPAANDEVSHGEMEGMDHSSDGSVPEGLQKAKSPKFAVGSEAIIQADHMKGMKGATATIVGAYDTTAYSINYTPTDGGEKVMDHKWVIHEELEDPAAAPLEKGTEVTVLADHMEGMDAAKAEIESAKKTTVYMIDYVPTTGGDEVTNHKWVVEDELSEK
ncbi:YdhK family protein [Sporosarcina aquimarina]|uniref:YdhK family protein n=1 Tax=Sporosarcina aquimarina TaxID=114975 RepID=A0ABU4G2B8_9BACL|nr:YdhK family protein [Sporosarcina aquimarina]MDW0111120.1 YdhK family protein [Sporosarcina aquimarina]